jgi:hypothetical protein
LGSLAAPGSSTGTSIGCRRRRAGRGVHTRPFHPDSSVDEGSVTLWRDVVDCTRGSTLLPRRKRSGRGPSQPFRTVCGRRRQDTT